MQGKPNTQTPGGVLNRAYPPVPLSQILEFLYKRKSGETVAPLSMVLDV